MNRSRVAAAPGLRTVLGALVLLAASLTRADEMATVTQQMCDKTKACMTERFGGAESLSAEMQAMAVQQMEMACSYIAAQYTAAPHGHPLYKPALACLKSMVALSCDELDDLDDNPTPACQAYEEKSEHY